MKTKINLTINSKLVPESKRFAKRKGKSVSQLVEELLEKTLKEEKDSFSNRWLGKLSITESDDPRKKYLKKRFDL